ARDKPSRGQQTRDGLRGIIGSRDFTTCAKEKAMATGKRPKDNGRNDRKKPAATASVPAAAEPPRWKTHLDFYRELRGLMFKTQKEFEAGVDLLWTDEFFEMPYALPGMKTIIVPADAVPRFEAHGLKFKNAAVISSSEIPPEEMSRIRRGQ